MTPIGSRELSACAARRRQRVCKTNSAAFNSRPARAGWSMFCESRHLYQQAGRKARSKTNATASVPLCNSTQGGKFLSGVSFFVPDLGAGVPHGLRGEAGLEFERWKGVSAKVRLRGAELNRFRTIRCSYKGKRNGDRVGDKRGED